MKMKKILFSLLTIFMLVIVYEKTCPMRTIIAAGQVGLRFRFSERAD